MYETSKKAAKNKQRHNSQAHTYVYSHICILYYIRAHGNHKPFFWPKNLCECVYECLYPVTRIFFTQSEPWGNYYYYILYFFLINISPPPHHCRHRLVRAFLPTRYYYTHRHHTHTHTCILYRQRRGHMALHSRIIITQRRPLPFTRPPRTHNGYFLFSESVSCTPDAMIHIITK
jgi:hypothetical protein